MKRSLLLLLFLGVFFLAAALMVVFGQTGAILFLPILAVGLVLAAFMLLDLNNAVLLFIFLMPLLHYQDLWLVLGLLLVASLMLSIFTKKRSLTRLFSIPLDWALVGFNLIIWISIFFSQPDQIQAISHDVMVEQSEGVFSGYISYYLLSMLFYIALVTAVDTRQLFIKTIWATVGVGVVAAFLVIVQGAGGLSLFHNDEGRFQAFFNNWDTTSTYLQTCVPLALGLYWGEKVARKRDFFGLMLIVLLLGWTFALLRTSIFAAAVMFLFALPMLIKRSHARYFVFLVPLLLVLVIWRSQSIIDNVQSIFAEFANPSGTHLGLRITQLRSTVELLKEYPWLGVGYGLGGVATNHFAYIIDPHYTAHDNLIQSSYVRVAADTGLIGLFAYLLIIGLALKELFYMPGAYQAIGDEQLSAITWGLRISLIGYLVIKLVHPQDLNAFYWTLLAYTAISRRVLTQEQKTFLRQRSSTELRGQSAFPISRRYVEQNVP